MSYKVGDVCRINEDYELQHVFPIVGAVVELTKVQPPWSSNRPEVYARILFGPAVQGTDDLMLFHNEIDLITQTDATSTDDAPKNTGAIQ